ncbi:hypothetical protein [Saccharomonospora sp. NB11]|jgi:hypothetical protein|uniref:hypothetical protein n=1 Tax=Saccharomonospora sp. NB11 TaxID=1642298 RepID=UPI0018D08460|nr:hypothetical protein [Saccharomonospora sp. NB11]
MTATWDVERVRHALTELDAGLAELETREDTGALHVVRALVEVYGEALNRVLALAAEAAPALPDALAEDELVGHLLLVHDLHPHDPETRIRRALAELAPHLSAELTDYADGTVTVSITGPPRGLSAGESVEIVQGTVYAAAPEVADVVVRQRSEPAFVPLTSVRTR